MTHPAIRQALRDSRKARRARTAARHERNADVVRRLHEQKPKRGA